MPSSRSTPSRWTFWLLIAAWVCANTPQDAAFHLIVWVKNARHFSHQAQLHSEVASILSGKPADAPVSLATATGAEKSPPPVAPADFAVKKILLSLVVEHLAVSPPSSVETWTAICLRSRPAHVADVPHPPPRA
jgi:hypothetical protein